MTRGVKTLILQMTFIFLVTRGCAANFLSGSIAQALKLDGLAGEKGFLGCIVGNVGASKTKPSRVD